ncbi:MAG: methyl-accepting chemotaxis protein [Candidatus Ratteibacteria bacterium]|nr:methyl-accepting chemotaxis protein [Candidatus Ratteibacteria bacterium]
MEKTYRRQHYIIQRPFQFKFALVIFLAMFTVVVAAFFGVYLFNWKLISTFCVQKAIYINLYEIFEIANWSLICQLFSLSILIAAASIFVSHKIAGPAYRLERNIRLMAKGDLTVCSRLRKNDEFQSLADSVEALTERLNDEFRNNRKLLEKLGSSSSLDEIQKIVEELKQVNGKFQLRQ